MQLLLLLVTTPAPPHMWGGSRAGATGLPAPPRGGGWGVETAWCHRLLLLLLSGSWAGGVEPTPRLVPHGWGGGGGGLWLAANLEGRRRPHPRKVGSELIYGINIAVVDTTSSAGLGGVLIPHTMALFVFSRQGI